jgi:PAS domain S-box-containing protein
MNQSVRTKSEQLVAHEARFRLVVEASPTAMLLVDSDQQIVLVNGAAESLFGYTRDELVGQSIGVLIPDRDRQAHSGLVAAYLDDATPRIMGAE